MPIYTFECGSCGRRKDVVRRVVDRGGDLACACGGRALRVPERFRAVVFTPHYDEGAGRDFYSARERREWMADRGVQEVGDPVHGARNFDAKAPSHIGKSAPKGIRPRYTRAQLEDIQANIPIETVDKSGKTVSRERFGDLGSLEGVRWHQGEGNSE